MQDTALSRSRRDLIAGGLFLAIALAFGATSFNYDLGSPLRMGPGFMPLLLAVCLGILGIVLVLSGLRDREMLFVPPVPWRGIALVVATLALFGLFARELGLLPIVFIGTALTAFASRLNSILSALAIALAMTALCYLVFKVGLSITLPSFGRAFAF